MKNRSFLKQLINQFFQFMKKNLKNINRFLEYIDATKPYYSSKFKDYILSYPTVADDLINKVKEGRKKSKEHDNEKKAPDVIVENSTENKKFTIRLIDERAGIME